MDDLEQEGQEQDQAQEEVDLTRDETLSSLFSNAASGHTPLDDPVEEDKEEPEEDKPEQTAAAQQDTITDDRYQALQDRITELTTRNNILQWERENGRQQQQTQTQEPQDITLDAFREAINKGGDPTKAIFELFKTQEAKYKAELAQVAERTKGEVLGVNREQKEYESDQASTVAQFGQLFKENQEFANLAENIYARMTAGGKELRPGFKWTPGAMLAAASMAYSQLHMAGKLQGNPKVVRMPERRKAPPNALVGNTGADKPRTIASDIPPTELRIMAKTAKSMGLSLDEYLKIYEGLQKRDPSYGRA